MLVELLTCSSAKVKKLIKPDNEEEGERYSCKSITKKTMKSNTVFDLLLTLP